MLTPDQISKMHRLHWVEKWSLRKIARHLHIGRRTLAKYLHTPAAKPARRERAHKIEPWKAPIAELLEKDAIDAAANIGDHIAPLAHHRKLTLLGDRKQRLHQFRYHLRQWFLRSGRRTRIGLLLVTKEPWDGTSDHRIFLVNLTPSTVCNLRFDPRRYSFH
jgi:hypothetical protein